MTETVTLTKILVVDDDPTVQRIAHRALTDAGYFVTVAGDGAAALRMLARWPADLVITDILMPDRDGYEVIQAVRRDHAGLKIIAMSARPSMGPMDTLAIAEKMGADRLLRKPFTPSQLLACVAGCLAEGGPGRNSRLSGA